MTLTLQPSSYDDLLAGKVPVQQTRNDDFLSELTELQIVVEEGESLSFYPIFVNLRFSMHEETLNGDGYVIGVKQAFLHVEPNGYNVQQNDRYGEVACEIKDMEFKETATKSRSHKTNANAELSAKAAKVKGELGAEGITSFSVEKAYKRQVSSIKPLTRNRWKILPNEGEVNLSGLLLNAAPLCKLLKKERANSDMVAVSLLIRKTDFTFGKISEPPQRFKLRRALTNEKLLAIFTGKVLSQKSLTRSQTSVPDKYILASQSLIGKDIP